MRKRRIQPSRASKQEKRAKQIADLGSDGGRGSGGWGSGGAGPCTTFQLAEAGIDLGTVLDTNVVVGLIGERIDASNQRGLGREDTRHLSLVLGIALSDH